MVVKGETINYLTMVSNPVNGKALFKCKCGNTKEIRIKDVRSGKTMSCGCLQRELTGKRFYKYGGSETRLCRIWRSMKTRCYSSNIKDAKNYIERGITVCEEWKNSFPQFQSWALSNGYSDDLTIDRIDNNKGYSPDNCRWATPKMQRRNQRRTIMVTLNGNTKSLIDWCEELGLKYSTIAWRIRSGWDSVDALTKPIKDMGGKSK